MIGVSEVFLLHNASWICLPVEACTTCPPWPPVVPPFCVWKPEATADVETAKAIDDAIIVDWNIGKFFFIFCP